MCQGSPPPAPDYRGAAEATAEGNIDATRAATEANRYTQNTPYGSIAWSRPNMMEEFDEQGYQTALDTWNNPQPVSNMHGQPVYGERGDRPDQADYTTTTGQDQWESNITLSPEVRALLDSNFSMQQGMADMGQMGLDQASSTFSTPFELDEYEGARQSVMDAMMSRVNTDIGRDRATTEAQLIASGIPRGSDAFNREMEQLDRKQTDARQRAEIAATDQALKDRGQSVTEALLQRQTPLNELNAFRTGSQVQMPTFNAGGMQQTTGGPDYLGATGQQNQYDLAGYNAGVAGRNNMMSGLFSLGAGGLAGGYFPGGR